MADKTLTITTPIASTPHVQIAIDQSASGRSVTVIYAPPGLPAQATAYTEAEVAAAPSTIQNAITTLFNAIVPNAATRMGF